MAQRYLEKLKKRGKKVRVVLGSFWGANLDRVYYYPSPEIAESAKRRRSYVMSYTKPLFTWLAKRRIGAVRAQIRGDGSTRALLERHGSRRPPRARRRR